MLWPMTFLSPLLNVANAKSEVLLHGQDHALVQALVPFTREKEVTIQQVLVFCHKPLKRAVGTSSISMSSDFKHGVGTTLTTERTHVFWYPKESGSSVFICFPYQDTSVTTRETCPREDALISISWFEEGQNCNYHTWE